jgi:hypothetical protein
MKSGAGVPDIVRVSIDRREDIEQMLDVDILRYNPLCFLKSGWFGLRSTDIRMK